MPKMWASTLLKLPKKLGISDERDREKFQRLVAAAVKNNLYDYHLKITDEEKQWMDALCENMAYPLCGTCYQPLCGSRAVCRCANNNLYQNEYLQLIEIIRETEYTYYLLENTPFRPSRNAFGFGGSIFGGMNLFVTQVVSLGTTTMCFLLIVPAFLLGCFVYWRGRNEEQRINADLQADFIEKKINLFSLHQESVQLRHLDLSPSVFLQNQPLTKLKVGKEKRHPFGNPMSHFIGGSLSTVVITYAIIKWGALASLVVVGGPATWMIAGSLGLAVGSYFAYQRYQHLSYKIKFENHMALIAATETDLQQIIEEIPRKRSPQYFFSYSMRQDPLYHRRAHSLGNPSSEFYLIK